MASVLYRSTLLSPAPSQVLAILDDLSRIQRLPDGIGDRILLRKELTTGNFAANGETRDGAHASGASARGVCV